MNDTVRSFYDDLADDYHLLFADWQGSIDRQSTVLNGIIAQAIGPRPRSVLDCACGIGTQTIGLALHGHLVHAMDVSPAAVARLRREIESRSLNVVTGVADIRSLDEEVPGTFDVVLACDNALPHLPGSNDLHKAVAQMTRKLVPRGLCLISVRDYDQIDREWRPRACSMTQMAGESRFRSGIGPDREIHTGCNSSSCGEWAMAGEPIASKSITKRLAAKRSKTPHGLPVSTGFAGSSPRRAVSTSSS